MPFEITRGIWVPEIIWLAFYSPKSHGMSRENVKIEVILTGLLFIQTPSNMKGKCLILTNFQGGFGLESTNRDFEFGTKSPQFHGHVIGILPKHHTHVTSILAMVNPIKNLPVKTMV